MEDVKKYVEVRNVEVCALEYGGTDCGMYEFINDRYVTRIVREKNKHSTDVCCCMQ